MDCNCKVVCSGVEKTLCFFLQKEIPLGTLIVVAQSLQHLIIGIEI